MTDADATKVIEVLQRITLQDLKATGISKYSFISRLLRSWKARRPIRQSLLKKQGGLCSLSGTLLTDNGRDVHIDHIWTIKEAVAAVEGGASIGQVYTRLWSEGNLRAVTPAKNYERNRKGAISA